MQRLEHRHRRHRRAVRVGDDPLAGVGDRRRVDLADDQRHVGVHPPRRRVVDDDRRRRRRTSAPAPATRSRRRRTGRCRGRSDRPCAASSTVISRALPRQGGAGRAGRGEVADLDDGEVALGEEPAHHASRPDRLHRRHRLFMAEQANDAVVPTARPGRMSVSAAAHCDAWRRATSGCGGRPRTCSSVVPRDARSGGASASAHDAHVGEPVADRRRSPRCGSSRLACQPRRVDERRRGSQPAEPGTRHRPRTDLAGRPQHDVDAGPRAEVQRDRGRPGATTRTASATSASASSRSQCCSVM